MTLILTISPGIVVATSYCMLHTGCKDTGHECITPVTKVRGVEALKASIISFR